MSAPKCKRTDDVAAFAMGAMDEHETRRFESHIEGCERCAAELEWIRPAVDALPESVAQVSPPPALRKRLLTTVRAEADGEPSQRQTARRRWWANRLHIGTFSFTPATALATVLIALAAVIGYAIGGPGSGDNTRTVPVASRPAGSKAVLELTKDSATLQAHGVPPLPAGSVYQVWVQTGSDPPQPSSTFKPNHDGSAAAAVPEALHGVDQVMVTREPTLGSQYPTSRPIYAARISN
jgi:anti-sigma-K factor RskA